VFRTDTSVVSAAHYSLHLMRPHPSSFGFPAYESPDGGLTWPTSPLPFSLEIPIQVRAIPEPGPAGLALFIGCTALSRARRGARRAGPTARA
jgi:hypothetical protein